MSFIMGITAVFMVAGIISGHRHIMGGHDKAEKVEQSLESSALGSATIQIQPMIRPKRLSRVWNHQAIVMIKGAHVIIARPR